MVAVRDDTPVDRAGIDIPRTVDAAEDILSEILEGALELTGADLGNVQLLDPASGVLRITAHAGFGPDLLDRFDAVNDDGWAGGRAARAWAQTLVPDVDLDRELHPHREIAAAFGFRAIVSTPLVDRSGTLVGVVSTYFRHPSRPADCALHALRIYGHLAGEAITRTRGPVEAMRPHDAPARAAQNAVNRIFAASLALASAQATTVDAVRQDRLDIAVEELDQAVKEIQSAALVAPRR